MWKCSECGIEVEGNFCGKCGGTRIESEPLQPTAQSLAPEQSVVWSALAEQSMPEEGVDQQSMAEEITGQQTVFGNDYQQKMPGNDYQQPMAEEKSGKKGCIIVVIVMVAIIALVATVIYFAINLIFNEVRGNREDRRPEIEVNVEGEISRWASPFNFDVWDSPEIIQIELGGVVLDVPMPPHTVIAEETGDCTAFFGGEDDWEDWFRIQVTLRNMMRGNFSEYFAEESAFNLEWHDEWAEVIDKQEFEEQDVGLMVTHWDAGWYEGFTFTKISMYQDAVLLVEMRFETVEGREEFFEAFGFMDSFGEVMRSVLYDIVGEVVGARMERIGLDSPEEAVIAFLEGVRDSDSDRTLETMLEDLQWGYCSEIVIGDFFSFLNAQIEYLQMPIALSDFQSLEIIGFLPPEVLSELYLSEENQTNLSNQAERRRVDQIVGRVVFFELGGEKLMLLVDAASVDEKWLVSGLGGILGDLLGVSRINRGIIPPMFLDEFIGEIDLEEMMIPVD